MSYPRYLTHEEADLIQLAAEHWLRLRDVEFNAGEYAAALLAASVLRDKRCARRDLATLDSAILLEIPGEHEPIPIMLVRPSDEDLRLGQVSILNDLGLACIGQVLGSEIRIPHGLAKFVGFADSGLPECAQLEPSDAHP